MVDGQLKIVIKVENGTPREEVLKKLKHELLHGLSDFDDDHSGLQGELGANHHLNEVTTEILRIYEETQAEVLEMLQQIREGKILCLGFRDEINQLLTVMLATDISDQSMSVSRLADYYFNKQGVEPGINAILLRFEIERNAYPKIAEQVSSVLEKFYR